MKDFLLSPYLLYPLIIAGMVSEFKFGFVWAGNLSMFALWVLTTLTFFILLIDSKDVFKKDDSNKLKTTLVVTCLFVQVAVGWIVTAVFFFIAWFFFLLKKAIYKDELTKAN